MGLLQTLGLTATPAMQAAAKGPTPEKNGPGVVPEAGKGARQASPLPSKDEQMKMLNAATKYAAALKQAQDSVASLTEPEASADKGRIQTAQIDAARSLAKAGQYDEAVLLLGQVATRVSEAKAALAAASASAAGKAKPAVGKGKGAVPPVDPAKENYEKERAKIQGHVDAAILVLGSHATAPTTAQVKAYEDANTATDKAVAAKKWAEATASLPALDAASLALQKAADDEAAYHALLDPFEADYIDVWNAAVEAGVPENEATAFWAAATPMNDAAGRRDWLAAKAQVAAVKAATTVLKQTLVAGQVFYTANAAAQADLDRGLHAYRDAASNAQNLAMQKAAWLKEWNVKRVAVDEKRWVDAKNAVATLKAASLVLAAAVDAANLLKAPFDVEAAKLTNLEKARELAAKAPKKIKEAEAKVFVQKYTVFNDARNNGDYAVGTAAVAPLQVAIDALIAASGADALAKQQYTEALAKITDLPAAAVLAAAPLPATADAAKAWLAADASTKDSAGKQEWAAAKIAADALKVATAKLLAARGAVNKAATPTDFAEFNKKLQALKPRTDKAGEADQTTHVDGLQRVASEKLSQIDGFVTAKDLAGAEATLPALVAALDAMEKGKADVVAHQQKFVAARDGEVKKARDLALQPAKLGQTRDTALADAESNIVILADQGKTAPADAFVPKWVREAKAWAGAKEAYDTLMAATPSEAKLKALADKPGGAEVMDALVASLPEATSQRVLSTAMKARFGIKIQSFEKKNAADTANLAGLTAVDPALPNKSLQKMYEILAKVPIDMKGKVTDIIDFKENANGGMYDLNKKIYMYCGRPDDPNAGKQEFSTEGQIVPEGEEVAEECKPVDTAPVPYFDFALLHEAGHAEDDAAPNFMTAHQHDSKYGGWSIDLNPGAAATAAATHFKYDRPYVLKTLQAAGSVPPAVAPPAPSGTNPADWEKARLAVLDWCKQVRTDNDLWNKAALSKKLAIGGRVYQEAYKNYWVSYEYAARSQGITGYQFRSQWEWFAELYAAYFSDKLQDSHPAVSWLKKYKTPATA